MSETNKTYRIKTDIGSPDGVINIDTNLLQDYDALDILSVKISSVDLYKLHNSNYGVIVGRVLANNGFGVPNAKLSIFISADSSDGEKVRSLYPFTNASSKDGNGVRYNLLPDTKVDDCHQVVGTFPNKRYMLDNDVVLEVFDKYYKYTTRTNNGGDYLIMGVPVGAHTLHMDLDLSDCGILSQKPRDFVYKGYTIEQFENPTTFKTDKELSSLSQIFTQDQTVNVLPFWGNETNGEQIGITRADISIAFKFETTCVFLGSVVSDSPSNGITKKCMATENMGNMEELTTGEGTIEMIRKTPGGEIEEFQINGTQLIDGNGVWCYQIPMNLDYMMTDEYGNMVPTDDPEKGIPTRASVRFRISMQDSEENTDNFYRAKVLVPHNPQYKSDNTHETYDYEFGTYTKDESFRDLFMDNVYSVKSYIPRFQKKKTRGWKDKNFTGFKSCNLHGNNNPIPYNNMRIRLPFMFTVMCAIIKCFIYLTGIFNTIISVIGNFLSKLGSYKIVGKRVFPSAHNTAKELRLNVLSEGLCPDLENWYFVPMRKVNLKKRSGYDLMQQTLDHLLEENEYNDTTSLEYNNSENEDEVICLTTKLDYLISCVEMNLAMEYKVINFDFYNDWINGMIYIPRFMYYSRKKKTFLGITLSRAKIKSCMDNTRIFGKTRRYTQQCAIQYKKTAKNNYVTYTEAENILDKNKSKRNIKKSNNFHKKNGFAQVTIFGRNGGICHEHTTSKKQNVYYMKPCEWKENTKILFYATDLILLGSLQTCNKEGIPQAFRYLSSTSYTMPTNLALTNMETNGALYMNDKNTLCAGKSEQLKFGQENENDAIRMFDPSTGLGEELKAYSGTADRNIDTQYEGDELSDLVPLTEAAGIAWNYTGPDQGEINEKQLYYPGGHFLGLTCTNSQSNIKSCLNLRRICELGVNMSQRTEEISEITFDKNTGESFIQYKNIIPTGLITGNEIVAEDFRSMFATLNQNRLRATKFNPETGYYMYNFDYVKPVNFDGVFSKISNAKEYNTEINSIVIDETTLESFGISNSKNRPDDEGGKSTLTTMSVTNEDNSFDYYRFRLGLDYDNLKNNDKLQKHRFLITNSSKYYLPQYENSYYFYFGMKQGETAIDEFNRQFFSVCDTTKIITGVPTIDLSVYKLEVCNGKGSIKVVFDNFELPLRSFYYEREIDGKVETVYLMGEKDNYKTQYTSIIENLDFAKYTFFATDSNGIEISNTIELGIDLFLYEMNSYDFNVFDSGEWVDSYDERNINDRNMYVGGYVKMANIDIVDEYKDAFINKKCTVIVRYERSNGSIKELTGVCNFCDGSTVNIYVPKANHENNGVVTPISYHIYLKYLIDSCTYDDSVKSEVTMYLKTFTVKDGKNVKLKIGSEENKLFYTIGSHRNDDDGEFTYPIMVSIDEYNNVSYPVNNYTAKRYVLSGITESGDLYFGNSGGISSSVLNPDGSTDSIAMGKWIKSVSTIKSNKGETFSNNVYTDNDLKVVWGNPQNATSVHNDVFCTESEIPEGYSLDDDASYTSTKRPYSSVAIDGTCVSGDFYGILEDGKYRSYSEYSNYKGASAATPTADTGYVFKPLPDGDLIYYTNKNGVISGNSTDFEKYEYTNGVYYSSFYYPVYEKPFSLEANFYIWNDRFVYMPENKDADPEIKYEELAGKCELNIKNGIRYKGKFGAEGKNLDATNFSEHELEAAVNVGSSESITVSAMTYRGYFTQDNGDEIEMEKLAYMKTLIGGREVNVASGYTGQTEVYYNFSEGYPDIESSINNENYNKEYYLSSLIHQSSEYFGYENNFSDYASYEFLPGEGLVAYFRNIDENKVRTYRYDKNDTDPFCLICYQPKTTSYKLIDVEDGNNKYHYLKFGSRKKPTYYILFRYVDKWTEQKEAPYHENKIGDLCFVKIDYYRKSKFRLYYSYIKYDSKGENDEDTNDEGGQLITIAEKYSSVYRLRNDIDGLMAEIMAEPKRKDGIKKYMEPVYKRKILVNTYAATPWSELINRHHNEYLSIRKDEQTDGYYYCVEKRRSNNLTLYKIYPTFLQEVFEDEGIVLSLYAIENYLLRDGNFYILTDKEEKYVTIKFELMKGDPNSSDEYVQTLEDAINKLKIKFGSNGSIIDATSLYTAYTTNWVTMTLNPMTYATTEEEYYNADEKTSISYSSETEGSFKVTFSLKVEFNDKNYTENTTYSESLTFYLNNVNEGETLRVTLYKFESYIVFFDGETILPEYKLIFDNTGGTQSVVVGISEKYLKGDNAGDYQIYVKHEDSNVPSTMTYSNEFSPYKQDAAGEYYKCRKITVNIYEGIRESYNAHLALSVPVPVFTLNYNNVLDIEVKAGEDGIWFEPNVIYYYIQGGEYNETTIKSWENKYFTKKTTNLSISPGIQSSLSSSVLTATKVGSAEELFIPLIDGSDITSSTIIKNNQVLSFVPNTTDIAEWYNVKINDMVNNSITNLNSFSINYAYDFEASDSVKTYTTTASCQIRPYSCVRIDNNYCYYRNGAKLLVFHKDDDTKVDENGQVIDQNRIFIPNYSDFHSAGINDEDITFNLRFDKAPESGIYYITQTDFDNRLTVLNLHNYGATNADTGNVNWTKDDVYSVSIPSKKYMLDVYGVPNTLYVKKIQGGDNVNFIIKIDMASFDNLLYPYYGGTSETTKEAYLELNGIYVNGDIYSMAKLGYGQPTEVEVNLKDYAMESYVGVILRSGPMLNSDNKIVFNEYDSNIGKNIELFSINLSNNTESTFKLSDICIVEPESGLGSLDHYISITFK